MADRLHVATRKGLFELVRGNGTWEVADVQFLGDPVSAVLADADGAVYAALDLGHFGAKLWARDAAGVWQELAPPAFPPKPPDTDGDPHPWSLGKIWVLEGGGVAGRLWAGTMPGGALPLRRRRPILVAERGAVAYARAPTVVGGCGRRTARHRLRAGRSAQSGRHPHRRIDRGGVGEHRWRHLVAQYQPRHVCRVYAAGAAPRADRPGRPPLGALYHLSRNRVVPAP